MRTQITGLAILCLLMTPGISLGSPLSFSYQGRIVGTNGPLEYPAVSFDFSITNTAGTCTLYREQKNGVNMTHSKGIFDTEIGTGTKVHPAAAGFSLLSAFQSGVALDCEEGGTFTALPEDTRGLRVQFYDGSAWRRISPLQIIRSVPFAGYALGAESALKLGNNVATDFLLKTGIPVCVSGDILTSTTAGVLTCVHDTGGAAGSVNGVAGSGAITVTESPPSSGNYTITATTGTTAGTLVAGNDARLLPAAASASGKYLKSDGTSWAGANITFADIKNSSGASAFNIGSCAANQTMKWSSLTDMFECQNIASVDAAVISSGVLDTARLGTGTADNTKYLRGDGTWQTLSVTESDPKVGANTTNYLSKWNGSALVASGVIESSGNVGIGTAAPSSALHVRANASDGSAARFQNVATDGYSSNAFVDSGGTARASVGYANSSVTDIAARDRMYYWLNSADFIMYKGTGGSTNPLLFVEYDNGNVGIGTTTPEAKLHINGSSGFTLKIVDGNQAAGKVLTSDANGVASWSTLSGTSQWNTTGSDIYYNTGKVGIGTSSVTNQLEVEKNQSSATIVSVKNNTSNAAAEAAFSAISNAGTVSFGMNSSQAAGAGAGAAYLYTSANTNMLFATNSLTRMTISGAGDIGIGTSSPGAKLEVNGAVKITDGNQGAGKVLTSDANGLASWTTPASANLASGVTGTLPVANGGTGATSLGSGNLLVGSGTAAVTSLAAGAAGNVVYATGIAAWSSSTPDVAGLVDKSSTQTISGPKGFTNYVQMSAQNELRLADADSSNYVALRSPATIGTNYTLTFPAAVGTAGQVLSTDASGNLSWAPSGSSQWITTGNDIYYNTGKVGIGTAVPTSNLSFSGQAAQTIAMERNSTANTAGNNLTIKAGSATSGASNKTGGDLYLASGLSTGSGDSNIYLQVPDTGSAATTDNPMVTVMQLSYKGAAVNYWGANSNVWENGLLVNNSYSSGSVGGAALTLSRQRDLGGISAGDQLGVIDFWGLTAASGKIKGASISSSMTGVGAGAQKSNLTLQTMVGGTLTDRLTIADTGYVGIGNAAPVVALDVNGAIKGTAMSNGARTIDFIGGNIQYTSADCGATQMSNMKSGATYNLVFQGTTGGTCSFAAYSGSGTTSPLTVKSGSTNLVQSSSTHIIFSFMVVGSYVYVMSAEGF